MLSGFSGRYGRLTTTRVSATPRAVSRCLWGPDLPGPPPTHRHPRYPIVGSPTLPRPRLAHPARCGNIVPAVHRLRCNQPRLRSRLTLGRLPWPRNPQASGVRGFHAHDATHSGIRTSLPSTSPHGLASPVHENAPLPYLYNIRGFGTPLEPRYVVGAASLDQ